MGPVVVEALWGQGRQTIVNQHGGTTISYSHPYIASRNFTYFSDSTVYLGPAPERYLFLSLFMHEAIPGHAFEQRFRSDMPKFLKESIFGLARAEGWALYVESFILDYPQIGQEYEKQMGEQAFIVQKIGHLSERLFRCARMIVDPLINDAKSRTNKEEAIAILRDAGNDPQFAEEQFQRYKEWPGQATSYLPGALEIRRLRPQTGLPEFHDSVLRCPLVAALGICAPRQEGKSTSFVVSQASLWCSE